MPQNLSFLIYVDAILLMFTYVMARPALAKLGRSRKKLGFWKSSACIVVMQTVAPFLALGMLNRWVVTKLLQRILGSKKTAVLMVETMEEGITLQKKPREVQLELWPQI